MNLELYHRQTCPHSAKVREFIHENELADEIRFFDIDEDESHREVLVDKTDDEQVPCLMVDGKPMLESDEIIAWLEDHLDELQTGETSL
jgi:glutaredoxin